MMQLVHPHMMFLLQHQLPVPQFPYMLGVFTGPSCSRLSSSSGPSKGSMKYLSLSSGEPL